nr:shematrin-like protein 2 isoform X1 [Cherax quadricarinatus]
MRFLAVLVLALMAGVCYGGLIGGVLPLGLGIGGLGGYGGGYNGFGGLGGYGGGFNGGYGAKGGHTFVLSKSHSFPVSNGCVGGDGWCLQWTSRSGPWTSSWWWWWDWWSWWIWWIWWCFERLWRTRRLWWRI